MPLYSIDSNEPVKRVPYAAEFNDWKSRLSQDDLQAIDEEFDRIIHEKLTSGTEIVTSSWLPSEFSPDGAEEWVNTPFFAIWRDACRQDEQATGWCFGLLLWEHMMNRDEDWCFMKSKDDEIKGTHYFLRSQLS